MAYPPAFTAYGWEDLPSENTPVDKAELNEAEKRLAKFAEEFQGVNWRPPVKKESELNSLYKPKAGNVQVGDVAYVSEANEIFGYGASEEWKPLTVVAPHWRPPVTKATELPTAGNVLGDVRFVTETSQFWYCYKTTGGAYTEQWKEFEQTVHHWLAPVKKESNLPKTGNVLGDVRFVEELAEFFYVYAVVEGGSVAEQWKPFGHVHTIEAPTWAISEKVTVAILPGPFRFLAANETQTVVRVEYELGKGVGGSNEVEFSVERYDAEGTKEWKPIASLEKLKLKKEKVERVTGLTVALHKEDRLRINIEKIKETPEAFALTVFIEHVAKVV